MPRIEYEQPLGPARTDRVAPSDKSRREQNRRRKESERHGSTVGKREEERADDKDRDAQTQGPGKLVDLEI